MYTLIASISSHIPGVLMFYPITNGSLAMTELIGTTVVSVLLLYTVLLMVTPRKSWNTHLITKMTHHHIIRKKGYSKLDTDETEVYSRETDLDLDSDEDAIGDADNSTSEKKGLLNGKLKWMRMKNLKLGSRDNKGSSVSTATLLGALNYLDTTDAKIQIGARKCCRELKVLTNNLFCRYKSDGVRECEKYDVGEIMVLDGKSDLEVVTTNDKLVCYFTYGCDSYKTIALDWFSTCLIILIIVITARRLISIFGAYIQSPVKEVKRIQSIDGIVHEIKDYSYTSLPRYCLLVLLSSSLLYAGYKYTSEYISMMGAEAASAPEKPSEILKSYKIDIIGHKGIPNGWMDPTTTVFKVRTFNTVTGDLSIDYTSDPRYFLNWYSLSTAYKDNIKHLMMDLNNVIIYCWNKYPGICKHTDPPSRLEFNLYRIMDHIYDDAMRCENRVRDMNFKSKEFKESFRHDAIEIMNGGGSLWCDALKNKKSNESEKGKDDDGADLKVMDDNQNNEKEIIEEGEIDNSEIKQNKTTTTTTTTTTTVRTTTLTGAAIDNRMNAEVYASELYRRRGDKSKGDDRMAELLSGKYSNDNLQKQQLTTRQLINKYVTPDPQITTRYVRAAPAPQTAQLGNQDPPAQPAPAPASPPASPAVAPPAAQSAQAPKVEKAAHSTSLESKNIRQVSEVLTLLDLNLIQWNLNLLTVQTNNYNIEAAMNDRYFPVKSSLPADISSMETGCYHGNTIKHQDTIRKMTICRVTSKPLQYVSTSTNIDIPDYRNVGLVIDVSCPMHGSMPSIDLITNLPGVIVLLKHDNYVDPVCKVNHLPILYYNMYECRNTINGIFPYPRLNDSNSLIHKPNDYYCTNTVSAYNISTDFTQLTYIKDIGNLQLSGSDMNSLILPNDWHGDFLMAMENDYWFRGGLAYYTQTSSDCLTSCPTSTTDVKAAFACCTGFKMIRSCPGAKYYAGNSKSNWLTAICNDYKNKNSQPEFINSDIEFSFKTVVNDIKVSDFSDSINAISQTVTVQVMTGCKEQPAKSFNIRDPKLLSIVKGLDSVQPTGTPKYYTYAGILTFKIDNSTKMTMLNYFSNLYPTYSFTDDTCGPHLDLKDRCLKQSWTGNSNTFMTKSYTQCAIDKNWIDIVERISKQSIDSIKVFPQDQPRHMTVIKFTVKDITPGTNGHKYDFTADNETNNYNGYATCPDSGCVMVLDFYIAAKMYGPTVAKVNVLGITLDTIQMKTGVCDDHNSFKYDDICYEVSEGTSGSMLPVLTYPMIDKYSMIVMVDTTNQQVEFFNFMATQPKCCSGTYIPKTSGSPYFHKGFNVDGFCEPLLTNSTGTFCNNKPAMRSFIGYMMAPVIKTGGKVKCRLEENSRVVCESKDRTAVTFNKYLKNGTSMTISGLSTKHSIDLNDTETLLTSLNNDLLVVSGMSELGNGTLFVMWIEMFHRDPSTTILLLSTHFLGFTCAIILSIVVLVFFINSYNLGIICRAIGFHSFLRGNVNLQLCVYCRCYIYNRQDFIRHTALCRMLCCPYCVKDKDGTKMAEKFATKNGFNIHMSLHKWLRINPVIGYIKCCRLKRLNSALISIALLATSTPTEAFNMIDFFNEHTRTSLRDRGVERNITLPGELFSCNGLSCTFTGIGQLKMPMIDSSTFMLSTSKEGKKYSNTYKISNPRLDLTCSYLYTSTQVSEVFTHTTYKCRDCVINCNDYNIRNGFCGLCPLDTSQTPVDDYYCPLVRGCITRMNSAINWMCGISINDGTLVAYTACKPDVNKNVLSVFNCKLTNSQTDIVNNGMIINTLKMFDQSVTSGMIFDSTHNVPTEFNVGVVIDPGSSIPKSIHYGLPVRDLTSATMLLPYTVVDIPLEVGCVPGMNYNRIWSEVRYDGSNINVNSRCYNPDIKTDKVDSSYPAIEKVIKCNFEKTRVSWTKTSIDRSPTYCGAEHKNSPIMTQRPSLNLIAEYCVTDELKLTVDSSSKMELKINAAHKKPTNITCQGYYNRNQMTMVTIKTDDVEGMVNLDCSSRAGSCMIELSVTKTCNMTVPLPDYYSCLYNDIDVILDCTGLVIAPADTPSGSYIGPTGSTTYGTWGQIFWNFLWEKDWLNKICLVSLILIAIVLLYKLICKLISSHRLNKITDKEA